MDERPALPAEEQALLDLYRHMSEADRLVLQAPAAIREHVADRVGDAYGRLLEEIVRWRKPCTLDDVRQMERGWWGQGLIYLLDQHYERHEPEGVASWRYDAWREWLHELDDEDHVSEVLADPQVRTIEDVVGWFRWHEKRLFPDMADEEDEPEDE